MTKRIFAALCVAWLVALTTGCAAIKPMAFKEPTEKLADKKNPVYLLTVSMENKYRTAFQPTLQSIVLARKAGPDKWEPVTFFIDMEGRFINDASGSGVGFAARMELEPGEDEFRSLSGNSYSFLLNPMFVVPMATPLTVGVGPACTTWVTSGPACASARKASCRLAPAFRSSTRSRRACLEAHSMS